MKSFVASPEEIAAISEAIARPRFVNAEMLSVVAAVDPAWLAQVIPAPLEPDGDSVRVMVGRHQSNCVADFAGCGVYVPARLGDIHGEYVLAMYYNTDAAILYGREIFGEPKKYATSGLFVNGRRASAWVERHGVRIIHLEADLAVDDGPAQVQGVNFNIKATPACDGSGLDADALVTVAEFDCDFSVQRSGPGALRLLSTPHDPMGSIPVGEVRQAVWQEGDLFARTRVETSIPAADFAPYFFARVDNYALLDTETRLLG